VAAPAFQLPDFANPATAARAWADAVELAQAKTVQLAIAAPKVAALDRISSADGSMCITNAAKTLKMQPKRLFAWLSECKWIYRRAGGKSWVAYQDRIQSGYLGHDVTVLEKGDGSEKAVTSIFVTAKGLAKLAEVAA
jgi:anti-repressor protein